MFGVFITSCTCHACENKRQRGCELVRMKHKIMNGKELAICKGPCCWERLLLALNHSLARFMKGARQSVSGSQVQRGPCRRKMGISCLGTKVFSDIGWIIYTLPNSGSLLGQCNLEPLPHRAVVKVNRILSVEH